MRLRSDFWVDALRRRAEAAGAYVSVARRGAAEAGAIFVTVDRKNGCFDLYGPAPQSVFGDQDTDEDRLFSRLVDGGDAAALAKRLDQEVRFDADLWLIDIEDREGRAFLRLAPDI